MKMITVFNLDAVLWTRVCIFFERLKSFSPTESGVNSIGLCLREKQ